MALPFFYIAGYDPAQQEIVLDEDTSKHVVQVLRMKQGEKINLTDGKGNLLTCSITQDNKKKCTVEVEATRNQTSSARKVSIAISLLKNANRFEWFLEKATEIGISEIIPLICERTGKEKFRYDRMQGICISAMLQSQQVWMPSLREPVKYEAMDSWVTAHTGSETRANFIAHCEDKEKKLLAHFPLSTFSHSLICIGPEGDFTGKEIALALQHDFIPVSLGDNRLRTETAGIVAATLMCQV